MIWNEPSTHYRFIADQERPPADPDTHRSVRIRPDLDGWSKVEVGVARP